MRLLRRDPIKFEILRNCWSVTLARKGISSFVRLQSSARWPTGSWGTRWHTAPATPLPATPSGHRTAWRRNHFRTGFFTSFSRRRRQRSYQAQWRRDASSSPTSATASQSQVRFGSGAAEFSTARSKAGRQKKVTHLQSMSFTLLLYKSKWGLKFPCSFQGSCTQWSPTGRGHLKVGCTKESTLITTENPYQSPTGFVSQRISLVHTWKNASATVWIKFSFVTHQKPRLSPGGTWPRTQPQDCTNSSELNTDKCFIVCQDLRRSGPGSAVPIVNTVCISQFALLSVCVTSLSRPLPSRAGLRGQRRRASARWHGGFCRRHLPRSTTRSLSQGGPSQARSARTLRPGEILFGSIFTEPWWPLRIQSTRTRNDRKLSWSVERTFRTSVLASFVTLTQVTCVSHLRKFLPCSSDLAPYTGHVTNLNQRACSGCEMPWSIHGPREHGMREDSPTRGLPNWRTLKTFQLSQFKRKDGCVRFSLQNRTIFVGTVFFLHIHDFPYLGLFSKNWVKIAWKHVVVCEIRVEDPWFKRLAFLVCHIAKERKLWGRNCAWGPQCLGWTGLQETIVTMEMKSRKQQVHPEKKVNTKTWKRPLNSFSSLTAGSVGRLYPLLWILRLQRRFSGEHLQGRWRRRHRSRLHQHHSVRSLRRHRCHGLKARDWLCAQACRLLEFARHHQRRPYRNGNQQRDHKISNCQKHMGVKDLRSFFVV